MRMKFIVAIGALAIGSLASAQETPEQAPIVLTLAATGPATLMSSFQRSVNGFFLDTFTFIPQAVSGNVLVSLMPTSGSVNFFSALLNDQGFSFDPDGGNSTFSFSAMVGSNQPLLLQVLGFGGDASDLTGMPASYAGTVTAAIPEPQTYALMLAGLALVAGAARKRRSSKAIAPA